MLKNKLTLMIHTCDKFSDLWETHIKLLNKNWADRNIDTLLVTDKFTNREFENLKVISTGEHKELSDRTKGALPHITTEFILITLDDYFLTKEISSKKIEKLVDAMNNENLDYIRLFTRPNSSIRMNGYDDLYSIKLEGNYQVNLYPGIWRKSFLEKTVKEKMNAWEYEVSLTKVARESNAKCALSKGKEFEILDVVRKGKLLNKANNYLKRNNMPIRTREVISYKEELRIGIYTFGQTWLPSFLFKFVKKTMMKFGHKFYSDLN